MAKNCSILKDCAIDLLLHYGDDAYKDFIRTNPKGKLSNIDYRFLKAMRKQVQKMKKEKYDR